MSEAWTERVDQLLYDGETIETEAAAGDAEIVVTSHRVLTFSPSSSGENFQTVDLPNVVGVDTTAYGHVSLLKYGLWGIVIGVGLFAGGQLLEIGSLFEIPSSTGKGTGLGGTIGTMQRFFDLFDLIDVLMVNLGLLVLCVGLLLLAGYGYSRNRYLSIAVAGDEDGIEVPLGTTTIDEQTLVELETRLRVQPPARWNESGRFL
jgi:hypothetical protein